MSSGVSSLLNKKDAFAKDSTIFIKLDKMHLISPCRSPINLNSPSSLGAKVFSSPKQTLNTSNISKMRLSKKNAFSMDW